MHIDIMHIKASTEAAYDRLLSTPSMALTRNPRANVEELMNSQIDAWMEDGYRKPKTKSDILDHRHRKLLRREKP